MLLVLALSLLVGVLAYQAPPSGRVFVGWLGDRLFLDTSPGLGSDAVARGDFYADDLTPDSPTGRSRWTRQHARFVLPNLGSGTRVEVTLVAQGWPEDVIGQPNAQPVVTVSADGTIVGTFTPTPQWAEYTFTVPADGRTSPDLTLDLTSSATFTDTLQYGPDPRPKGLRLAEVRVQTPDAGAFTLTVLPPAWQAVALFSAAIMLLYVLLASLLRSSVSAFILTVLGAGLAGVGLALARIWMGAALNIALWVLGVALLLTWQRPLLGLFRALVRRYSQGRALGYGLVTAALAWMGYVLARISRTYEFPGLYLFRETFPDSLLYGLLGVGLLALTLVLGREGLPRLANGIVALFGSRRGALVALALFGGVWLGYEWTVVRDLPYVGHADYADNAVVARNLVAGRGWVVDYVTQFYQLYDGVTRPQETWPLLQPVWIAPFLALFGEHAWAAKIPNLIFNVVLLVLIYVIGAQLWDRRVGVTAAIITLTSHLFFNLTIYTTSDLGFVVFSLGAIYLLYRATTDRLSLTTDQPPDDTTRVSRPASSVRRLLSIPAQAGTCRPWSLFMRHRVLIGSGVLTGLMMLQKPSGAVIAVGMGLWLLAQAQRTTGGRRVQLAGRARLWEVVLQRWVRVGLVWALPALLILSPYVIRNLVLFGTPIYSTERYDAWVLGYRGNSEEAWEDIYRVYAPELGGPGLPDRSWILRWGFDHSFDKFQTQITAARDYLMPAWSGLPGSLRHLVSSDEDANLMAPLSAWLALLGVIAALRSRRRLLSLLFLAFGLYTIFLMTYWRTNEWRYFVMLVPWLALLVSWMIWAGFDRLAAIGDGRWSPLGLILVGVAIVTIVRPAWPEIAKKVEIEPANWAPDLAAYEWLREHTAPGTVIMTRVPWQLNWHTERPAVMIPNTSDRDLLHYIARYYDAEYLVLENQLRVKGDAALMLAPLLAAHDVQVGDSIHGFTLVYLSPTPENRALIYRFSEGGNQPAAYNEHALQMRR